MNVIYVHFVKTRNKVKPGQCVNFCIFVHYFGKIHSGRGQMKKDGQYLSSSFLAAETQLLSFLVTDGA